MSSDAFDDDLMVSVDTTEVTPEDLASRGGGVDDDCKCHLFCQGVQMFREEGKVPNIRVDFKVVACDKPKQVGKMYFHRVYLQTKDKLTGQPGPISAESKKILLRFARGMELITDADLGKPNTPIPFHLLQGRQCCAHVKREAKKDETTKAVIPGEFDYRVNFGEFFPVHHEVVQDYPKDPEVLAMSMPSGTSTVNVDNV
jgi:hypothetical protein